MSFDILFMMIGFSHDFYFCVIIANVLISTIIIQGLSFSWQFMLFSFRLFFMPLYWKSMNCFCHLVRTFSKLLIKIYCLLRYAYLALLNFVLYLMCYQSNQVLNPEMWVFCFYILCSLILLLSFFFGSNKEGFILLSQQFFRHFV